ncbi:acyl-CoA N-acyltransferase [Schizophyllum amplum]|uniref:Histone acetyltransferase type B catalytic subunit n=1 Tax=Schizophyllum amplum TaxID=97359 RepID=A0A550C512_9AGAR|nr:acyl-CoA N-acyltransferase [Auriculariopsis ampla]
MADWTSNTNEALNLSLVRAPEDQQSLAEAESYTNFHPAFTYPIYGEDETVYGYKDLRIDLRYASGSLAQYLSIEYPEKLPSSSTVDDVEGTLRKFIPPDSCTDETTFNERVAKDATTFTPPGERIHVYTRPSPTAAGKGKGKDAATDPNDVDVVEFEIYHATWSTPGMREYHRRMQIFILLYIEGGSYIDEDEDTWEFMLLYRKRRGDPTVATYHFVGYSTLYPFYCYPERVRMRLSQFVILPPYQRHAHGSELYNAIYQFVVLQPQMAELTVEDPAEAFEDLRDVNDLRMLLGNTEFMEEAFGVETVSHGGGRVGGVGKAGRSGRGGKKVAAKGKLGPPADKAWCEKWRVKLKLATRQYQRLVEMLIMMHISPADAAATRAFRLQVKERLYRFNFEVLAQLEKEERLAKLEETFQNVREDYSRLLAKVRWQ